MNEISKGATLNGAIRLKSKRMTGQTTKPIRIAILLGVPFTEQNYERIGIPYLSPHFELVVFDCLKWVGRNADEIKCKRAGWQQVATINTELDFEENIKRYAPSYVIDATDVRGCTTEIQAILIKYNVKFVVTKEGTLPVPSIINRIRKFLVRSAKLKPAEGLLIAPNSEGEKLSVYKKAKLAAGLLVNKWQLFMARKKDIFPPDISLVAGNESFDSYAKRASQIIWTGSNDFHQFKKIKRDIDANKKIYVEGGFILFIDDAIPTANDWALLNMKPPVTAAEYYSTLRAFFERVESHYGLPVVIAGHPNSKADEKYPSNIGGRAVIFGETAALVLQSALVLVHGSTAVSFAVLARKPTLFFTTRELDESAYGIHVRTMAKSLGRPLMFMDELNNFMFNSYPLTINENKYRLYETNYLRSERSREEAPWSAFIDFVSKTSENDVHHE